jgi:carbon-monoxide dehydrogenase medium subunit
MIPLVGGMRRRKGMRYEKPKSVSAIVDRLSDRDTRVSLLAGGTDLLGQIRSRLIRPDLLLDVKGVKELQVLDPSERGLRIGAAVILNRVLEERETTTDYAALRQSVAQLASYSIRNRATLVGNVANASPCADTVPPLCVMGAQVEVQGPSKTHGIPVHEFITGNRETRLGSGEFVTGVVVPAPSRGTWSGFRKCKRVKGHDLALANAALQRDPERQQLRLSIGSCSPKPVLCVLDEMFDRPDADEAARLVQDGIRPIDDVRASIEYRRDMVTLMVHQLFDEMTRAAS